MKHDRERVRGRVRPVIGSTVHIVEMTQSGLVIRRLRSRSRYRLRFVDLLKLIPGQQEMQL